MAIELELKPGQTPLDPDEVAGLKPRHIANQGELDEWEAQNILKASRWIARQKKLDVLNDHFCRELHVKMFDDTWKWAGTFRKSDKNIGCDWTQIAARQHGLLAGAQRLPARRGCRTLSSSTCLATRLSKWKR